MSSIPVLSSSSLYHLLSQSAGRNLPSANTAETAPESASSSASSISMSWQDTVKLAFVESSLSLTEQLLSSNNAQNRFANPGMSIASMTAMQQGNLFETDPLLASGASTSAAAAGSQTDFLKALTGSNTSSASASQLFSQTDLPLSYSSNASMSDTMGSLFDLIA
jgi:hypothetical protein